MQKILLLLTIVLIISSCKKDEPLPDISTGLIAYFPFDGSAFDSLNQISGTIHNAISTSNRRGKLNKAMLFSRDDTSFISFPDNGNYSFLNNTFTINCWVKVTDTSKENSILSKRGFMGPFEYSLDSHFNHTVFNFDNWVWDGNGSVYGIDPLKASAAIDTSEWQMITYIANGDSLVVYLNGNVQSGIDLRNASLSLSDTDAALIFGIGGGWGVNYYFSGAIDDVSFYNRALTAIQIKALYRK